MSMIQTLVRDRRFDRQHQLVGEHWRAVRQLWLDDTDAARIKSDLPENFLLGVGMPGIANIKPIDNDRFEIVEDGLTALVIPAYDTIPGLVGARAERHVEELRDLVAVDLDLDHPDRFWRRRGEAVVLGNAFLEIAGQEGEPITVFKNPISWLKAAGAGIVGLNWDHARDLLLDHVLIAEGLDLGDLIEDALRPDIWITETAI